MSLKLCCAAFAATAIATAAIAQDEARDRRAEFSLSNDTLQLRYITEGDQLDVPSSQVSGGVLLSEQRDIVIDAGILFPAKLGPRRLTARVGPRAFAALLEDENDDVLAMALGTEVRFALDRERNLSLVGHAFYSPDILTFGSADTLSDFSARAEMRVADTASVFAGMRWFEFDLTEGGGERTLQEELFVGGAWHFR